ncbi:FAD binding domain-containing protein [Frigoribacterium sp. 2-23]|uniref:FAD binding domain-containing protein n=1 Tax=Frigoribacterium sp. 2-23 TaxID=3415006 RepID=UPI003C6FFA78
MDLITVREIRVPRDRSGLVFGPGEHPLGGGTWLFSEPQPGLTGLVDLTTLGWTPLEVDRDADRLTVAATCTIAELTRLPAEADWLAHPLIGQCANSLLASFKIWNTATVGGNIATSLPAGPMTSLMAALDATALVWTADGGERHLPVSDFVTGVRQNALGHGDVLRALEVPLASLRSRTAFRRIALSELGRSGTLVIGRVAADGELVITVTAGTPRPVQLSFAELPSADALETALLRVDDWYDDPHGAPDWRRHVSTLFAHEIRDELAGPPPQAPPAPAPAAPAPATAPAPAAPAAPAGGAA